MTIVDTPPLTVATVAALIELTDCVCHELSTTGAGPTCWCGLYPGATVSWEYCGECGEDLCGMGYVRLAAVFPYETFPVPLTDYRCQFPLAWSVEVGSLRCLRQPEDGSILGPAEMTEVGVGQLLDAGALYRAIKCCGIESAVEVYVPVGPSGGCVGGFWRAYLAIDP